MARADRIKRAIFTVLKSVLSSIGDYILPQAFDMMLMRPPKMYFFGAPQASCQLPVAKRCHLYF